MPFTNEQIVMICVAILVMLQALATGVNSVAQPQEACSPHCGNLTIPFPFGTSSDCFLDESFLITCNYSYDPPRPFLNSGSTQVLDISLDGLMKVASSVASDCYDKSGTQISGTVSELMLSKFPISSTRNKFIAVGCDTYALVEGSEEWKQMSAGCVSWCDSIDSVVNGTCSGIGCCQTSIPKGIKDYVVDIRSFRNHTRVTSFNPCGYAFVVESEAFEFTSSDLKDFQNRGTVPVALDWSVGNMTCQEAQRNYSTSACRAEYSACSDSSSGQGYRCNCLTGFQGNPYLLGGCHDIDECDTLKPCKGICTNFPGSYSCPCPEGFEGDGKKDGGGCHPKSRYNASTLFYIASGFMVPAVGSSWIFWRRKQKKVVKLRQILFRRNGGMLLERILMRQPTLIIFTAEDLKKATNNYDEANIIRRVHPFQNSYKGLLPGRVNQKLTVKQCNKFYGCDIRFFIYKLVSHSEINHRNVLKLLGCCLETQVPSLVYEFGTPTTLYDYIGHDGLTCSLSWDIRLKIAAETAGALAYMHSAESVSLIHGNLTSSSILLGYDYRVKLHDFALTSDHIDHISSDDDLSLGYFDPDCLLSGQLTVENDVYCFGVILTELLTGKRVTKLEGENDLVLVLEEGLDHLVLRDFVALGGTELLSILDHHLLHSNEIVQVTKVAKLAHRCLSSRSEDRPTMQEVEMELECATRMNFSSTAISPNSSQGTIARRIVRRNRSF